MTTINLKDFYYWYIVDELVEVPDEVAEELLAGKRAEAAHAERVRYRLLFYLPYIHLQLSPKAANFSIRDIAMRFTVYPQASYFYICRSGDSPMPDWLPELIPAYPMVNRSRQTGYSRADSIKTVQ